MTEQWVTLYEEGIGIVNDAATISATVKAIWEAQAPK